MIPDDDDPQPPSSCCVYKRPYGHREPWTCPTCGFMFGVACDRMPANDEPWEVRVEIRAAELAALTPKKLCNEESMFEWCGRVGYPDSTPTTGQAVAGYLACEIRGAR